MHDGMQDQALTSLDFGQFKGKTYEEVLASDPDYCDWVLREAAWPNPAYYPGEGLLKFAAYIQQVRPELKTTAKRERVNNIVQFGKYKGHTFEAVLKRDLQYCTWLTAQEGPSPTQTYRFKRWLGQRDISALNATSGQSENVVKFGKHIGSTFQMVLKVDPQYCEWLLSQEDSQLGPDVKLFKDWLKTQEIPPEGERREDIITFGEHKGKSFQELLEEDQEYCEWAVDQVSKGTQSPRSNLYKFVAWMKERLATNA